MGAGFGMMMPGMIQQAMAAQRGAVPAGAAPAATAMPPATAAPLAAAAGAAAAGGGLDFGDLAPVTLAPKDLVRSVANSAGWQVQETGDAWQIVVPVGPLRKQTVAVQFGGKDDEGHELISISSICGPASDRNAMALLRYNTKMVHGAFAVLPTPSGEMIVVQANQLADTADPLAVTRVMTAVAWQADKAEEKLGGGDRY
ncbi:MAG: SPFH domain-containing protein, partial [Pirellulaceae bacterium]|nr:SPFH domain-containing protein [Pirellulaceae bacterium]